MSDIVRDTFEGGEMPSDAELIKKWKKQITDARLTDAVVAVFKKPAGPWEERKSTYRALSEVADEIELLEHLPSRVALTEEEKQEVVRQLTEAMEVDSHPEFTKRFGKCASIDQQIIVINDIKDLLDKQTGGKK